MNFKTTLVLLVLVVIGLALWYFAGAPQPVVVDEESGGSAQNERRYVLAARPDHNDIVRLRIERPDQPGLVFERTEKKDQPGQMEDWRMIEPLDSATVSYLVSGLVTALTGLQYKRSFQAGAEGGVSLADAGLEPPVATFTLTDQEGEEYTFEIGKPVALSNDTYMRVAGNDEVFVVARSMSSDIEREVNDYRAKNIMKLVAADARHLRVDHDGRTYDVSRGAGDEWVINQPVKAYARAEKVQGLVSALGAVRVKEYIDDAPQSLADYGLESPFLTISVTTEKKELIVEEPPEPEDAEEATTQPIEPRFELVKNTYTLAVGQFADLASETRYVKLADQPWVASATQRQLDSLIPKLSELRDPSVTRVKADDIRRLETTGDGSATLEKRNGEWHGTGDLAQLDVEALNKVLQAFEDVSAIDYIDDAQDLAKYGLDAPRAILSATTAGAVEPVSLRIGADTASGRNTYVQVAGQSSVMVISAQRAADLAVKPLSLRSRVITSGTPEQIKRISLQRLDQHYALERKADGKGWRLLEPAGAPPDPASIRELVNDLSRLRARQVVARDDDESYGLKVPALTAQFVMELPADEPPDTQPATQPTTQAAPPAVERIEHTLRVGRKDDKTYARIDDDPYVFQLHETVYKVLTQELIHRRLFDLKAKDVVYLKIEAPGGTVEFQREDQQWTYPPDKFVKLSQKKVGDFVNELADLRVSGYVAYRDGNLAAYGLEEAPVTVTIRLKDESAITLKVDQVRAGELPRKAAWVEQQRIFLLRPAEAEKLMRGLDYYVKQESAEADDDKPQTP